jgi:hypothetical protein
MNLSPDVLEALHNGENLCPRCLGRKYIKHTAFADFIGDRDRVWLEKCTKCKGSGLD